MGLRYTSERGSWILKVEQCYETNYTFLVLLPCEKLHIEHCYKGAGAQYLQIVKKVLWILDYYNLTLKTKSTIII